MEKKTVFIKRYPIKGELPEYGQRVIGLVLEQNDLGLSKFLWNVSYHEEEKKFFMDGDIVSIEYWLEEIELPSEDNLPIIVQLDAKIAYHDYNLQLAFDKGVEMCYNFILNHLKSNTNG